MFVQLLLLLLLLPLLLSLSLLLLLSLLLRLCYSAFCLLKARAFKAGGVPFSISRRRLPFVAVRVPPRAVRASSGGPILFSCKCVQQRLLGIFRVSQSCYRRPTLNKQLFSSVQKAIFSLHYPANKTLTEETQCILMYAVPTDGNIASRSRTFSLH